MGERPLRNISSEGTAVQSPLKEASFQTRINSRELDSQKCLTEILYQTGSSSTQPRSREAVAAKIEHCMKGNVALKIGPMTSSDRCDVIYTLTTQFYKNDTSNLLQ